MNLLVFPSDTFFRNYRFIELSVITCIFLSGYRLSVIAIRLFVIDLSIIAIRISVIVPTTGPYTQLYDYLENNSILHKQQYGFRAKKSTTQAILHFLQYLYKHIDSGNIDFVCSWIFARHLIVLTTRSCYQS